jgi:hypothetical protein
MRTKTNVRCLKPKVIDFNAAQKQNRITQKRGGTKVYALNNQRSDINGSEHTIDGPSLCFDSELLAGRL